MVSSVVISAWLPPRWISNVFNAGGLATAFDRPAGPSGEIPDGNGLGASPPAPVTEAPPANREIPDFFERPIVADLHNDRSFFLTARQIPWRECRGVQLCDANYRRSSYFFSIWRPPLPIGAGPPWRLSKQRARQLNRLSHFQYLLKAIADLKATGITITDDPGAIGAPARSMFLGIEGAFLVNDGHGSHPTPARLDDMLATLKRERVSYVGLVWSNNNVYAGTSRQPGKGLTTRGRELVRLLSKHGLLADLSHGSDRTVRDFHALTRGRYPLFFSHSSARAVCNHPRNVSDSILRLVRETGGIVGINFYRRYINCSSKASIHDVADHIMHIYRTAGPEHVALGSDFDGLISLPNGLKKPQNLRDLAVILRKRNLSQSEIEKIFFRNVQNFLYAWQESKKVDAEFPE